MFVHACFMGEVNNDPVIKRMDWYILYEVLQKSVARVIMDQIH